MVRVCFHLHFFIVVCEVVLLTTDISSPPPHKGFCVVIDTFLSTTHTTHTYPSHHVITSIQIYNPSSTKRLTRHHTSTHPHTNTGTSVRFSPWPRLTTQGQQQQQQGKREDDEYLCMRRKHFGIWDRVSVPVCVSIFWLCSFLAALLYCAWWAI